MNTTRERVIDSKPGAVEVPITDGTVLDNPLYIEMPTNPVMDKRVIEDNIKATLSFNMVYDAVMNRFYRARSINGYPLSASIGYDPASENLTVFKTNSTGHSVIAFDNKYSKTIYKATLTGGVDTLATGEARAYVLIISNLSAASDLLVGFGTTDVDQMFTLAPKVTMTFYGIIEQVSVKGTLNEKCSLWRSIRDTGNKSYYPDFA